MFSLTYFRHKIAITLTLFATFLSVLFCILVWLGIEKSDDNARSALLTTHAERFQQYFQETGKLWKRDQLTGIEILVEGRDAIPDSISGLPKGYSEDGESDLYIYKSQLPMSASVVKNVYLVHEGSGQDWSEQYESVIFLLLGTITLFVIFIGSVVGVGLSRKISSPLQILTERIKATDPNAPSFAPLKRSDEFGEISDAFSNTLEKISEVLEREKQFSRYASHELRTPVAIINSSINLWRACDGEQDVEQVEKIRQRALERISIATKQMEDVIQTFLVLGKNGADWNESPPMLLHMLLDNLLEKYQHLNGTEDILVERHYHNKNIEVTRVTAVSLILSNVFRNAFDYCASKIQVELDTDTLTIINDIDALRVENADHFGFGIKIIEDLSGIVDWKFSYEHSQSGHFKMLFALE